MILLAAVDDRCTGICYSHEDPISVSGVIYTGSPSGFKRNKAIARHDDLVRFDCGHIGKIVARETQMYCDSRAVAQLNDVIIGSDSTIDAKIIEVTEM